MVALVLSLGAACAYAGSAGAAGARQRPPKLRAGETWSYVSWRLRSGAFRCSRDFGDAGLQVCDGTYDEKPAPDPGFGGWGFTGGHNGTVRASKGAHEDAIFINFFTPGAEILGEIPSKSSDRYTVRGNGPRGWRIESPVGDRDYYDRRKAGEKGGPLNIDVTSSPGQYFFTVKGWVVVVRSGI